MANRSNSPSLSDAAAEAARAGDSTTVIRAIDGGLDVDSADHNGTRLLHIAAATGDTTLVKALLEGGADANATAKYGMTPLLFAAQQNKTAAAEMLIDAGADLGAQDLQSANTVLNWAENLGHHAMAEMLRTRGAQACQLLPMALVEAARAGDAEAVRRQVNAGLDPNARLDSLSLLHWAASGGHTEMARILIEHGASVDAINKNGITPLIAASLNGHETIARMLLDADADPNCVAENDLTAIGGAKDQGHVTIQKLLEDRGAEASS